MMMLRQSMVAASLLLAAPLYAESADKGLPAQGATVTLKPTSTGYEAGITIARDAKYTDVEISTTDPELCKILQQRVDKETLSPASTTAPRAPGAKPPKPPTPYVKLITVVLRSAKIRAGEYPLTLIATSKGRSEVRDLIVALPAAHIDAPDTLVVINDPLSWSGAQAANQPQIWETTQHAWLTGISLDQKGNTDADGRPAGRIVPKGTLADIPPGHSGRIELDNHYFLKGSFPLGTAKGKLILQADQLTEPVTFGFEVRSRISVGWLFLPLGFGLLLGFITRTTLTNRLKLNQERENTYALIALIDRALARNADSRFQAAATQIRADAEEAAKSSNIDKVKDERSRLQNEFQGALDTLTRRRGELDKEIAAVLTVLSGNYMLPSKLADTVRQIRDVLKPGLRELESNDVTAAAERLETLRAELGRAAVTVGNNWLRETESLTQGLDQLAPLDSDSLTDLKQRWATSRTAATTAVRQLENDANFAVDKLGAVLQTLHVGAHSLADIVANVSLLIKSVAERWTKILGNAKLPKPDVWSAWQKQAKAYSSALEASSGADPSDDVIQFKDRTAEFLDAFRAALADQASDANRKEIADLLNAGKYDQAVNEIATSNPRASVASSTEGLLKGEVPEVGAEVTSRALYPVFQLGMLASNLPTGSVAFVSSPRQDLTPIDVLAATAHRAAQEANGLLSLIYAALIAGAAYFLFADKWIGTPLDFALVFFWAYATDIGAEAATAAVKGVKRE